MAKEAISEVPIPLPYALNLIYDTTRLSILCSKSEGASYALKPY